jgi:rhamnose transport system substrate-binding protein
MFAKMIRISMLGMVLVIMAAACGPAATQAPAAVAPTEAPAATQAPAAAATAPKKTSGFTMCFMPKFIGHPLFTLANEGAQAAAKEVGDTVNYVGSTEIDASKQIEWINNCTQQGVDAIIVGALDPNALVPALNAAKAKGILTNTWDADVDPSARTLFFSTPTPEDLGSAMADMLGDAMNWEGKWAWLSSGPDVANQVAWINATEAYIKANPTKFAKMQEVTTVYGESDDAKSYTAAEGLLARYPDLKGIISPDAAGLPAGARAIQDGGKCGKVFITGVALPSAMTTFVHAGCVKSFALWHMDDLGYLSVYLTHQLLVGAIKGDVGEVVQVGKLGQRTILDGKIIAVGKPLIYTIDNVDK